MPAIMLGCFSLLDMPFGTALGIYTLWVLLPASRKKNFGKFRMLHDWLCWMSVHNWLTATTRNSLYSQSTTQAQIASENSSHSTVPRPMGEFLDYIDCGL